MHLIGRIHTGFQWLNRFGHAGVIHRADAEVEIFIRLGAHGGDVPCQVLANVTPAGVVHTLLKMHWGLHRTPAFLIFTRKTREFIGIVPATKSRYASIFSIRKRSYSAGRHLSIGGIFNRPAASGCCRGDAGMRPDGWP